MTVKKQSPELKARMSLVVAAARELKSHHFTWIVDAAADEFRDRLQKTEQDIVRHNFFADRLEENTLESPYEKKTRYEMRARLEETRTTYRDILAFLRALQNVAAQVGDEEFADGMRDLLRQHKTGKL